MHPDHSMGTMHPDHSMGTMHPDHSMGTHHSLGMMHPDHSFRDRLLDHSLGTMHPDHSMGIIKHPDHIYDRELNNDILHIQQKMRKQVKSEILDEIEDDIEDNIERQENILQSLEGYCSPCGDPELEMLKQTCHPLTSHKSHSFEMAEKIRTLYDKHWLKIYNGRVMSENFCLTSLQYLP